MSSLPARRDEPSQALTVPAALRNLGVTVHAEGGSRAIMFPPDIHEKANVLLPVNEIAQADPFYTPSLRVIYADMTDVTAPSGTGRNRQKGVGNKHVYWQESGQNATLSLTKLFILALANAAGVTVEYTSRIAKDKLESETIEKADGSKVTRMIEVGWEAAVLMRRSDGTLIRYVGSRTLNRDIERETIKQRSQQWRDGKPVFDDGKPVIDQQKFHRNWAQERDVMDQKLETKALLRAMAGILQIQRGGYTMDDLRKPFVVVGFNFTPDYGDERVRQIVMQSGINATAKVFGGMPPPPVTHDGPTGGPVVETRQAPPLDDEDDDPHEPIAEDPEPGLDEPTGETESTTQEGDAEEEAAVQELVARAQEAGKMLVTEGKKYEGRNATIEDLHSQYADVAYIEWLARLKHDVPLRAAARLYLAVIVNGEITFEH